MKQSAANLAFAAVSLLVALTAFGLGQRGDVEHQSFKAFYCAGVAVRERFDPYRVEPLRSCEHSFERGPMPTGYVEPAPLPGYALVPFAMLSMLPQRLAAELFAVILALAAIVSARCLAAAISLPATAVLLALTPLTLLNIAYGETAPLATLAICASAYLLSRHRWQAAGFVAALALLQPNAGLPAALAVFAFVPRSRIAILVSGASLALISLAALGVAENVEYFTRVLPLIAKAELLASDQYGLSRLLYTAGIAPSLSLSLAKVWFVCTTTFGIIVAGILSARSRQATLLPLLPPAAVLLFGIYLHDIQILIALPAALAIAARAPSGALRALGATALALLVAVWTQKATRATLAVDVAGVFGALFAVMHGKIGRRVALAAAGALATVIGVVVVTHVQPPLAASQIVTHGFTALPDEFAPVAWARYLQATAALTRHTFAPQLAAWLGLIGLLAGALAVAVGKPVEPKLSRS